VSEHGTARILDISHDRHVRVSFVRCHAMELDGEWLDLGVWCLTPCGLVVEARDRWTRGTPLWLVAEGSALDWPAEPIGAEVVAAIEAQAQPFAPRHPDEPCAALYCRQRSAN
jgi:hypothetical protein